MGMRKLENGSQKNSIALNLWKLIFSHFIVQLTRVSGSLSLFSKSECQVSGHIKKT